jgi:hypothetical protein
MSSRQIIADLCPQGQLEEFIWRALAMHKTAISRAVFLRKPMCTSRNTAQPLAQAVCMR